MSTTRDAVTRPRKTHEKNMTGMEIGYRKPHTIAQYFKNLSDLHKSKRIVQGLLIFGRQPGFASREDPFTPNPHGSREMPSNDLLATYAILPLTLRVLRDGVAPHIW